MHRLGSNAPPSAPSLPNPVSIVPTSIASTSSNDPWGALHVNLLPLFNREPLRIPIEELNNLVKRHISSVISVSPPKALASLEHDTVELLSSGMVTLNARLAGIDDDKLIPRVVELWGFFWDQVLTYVEGVGMSHRIYAKLMMFQSLLPLQTDPLLQALYNRPKRPSSPTRSTAKAVTSQKSASQIDVRNIALRCFRDKIIVPLSSRLYTRLSSLGKQDDLQEAPPRLEQMSV
ncbi:HbrB-domain-containing protein [Dendrothele bispora CBS 962.96]|uniref:HbrB-domain-containing protein n=1 Tax=Dendrothele bispora (strain CBS 962.96) TaxID=1314807 RepID=A0A4S8MU75_DENBC|nr:HbrB-domain-containing protein [Dendrothele bispora CBS 962.96]